MWEKMIIEFLISALIRVSPDVLKLLRDELGNVLGVNPVGDIILKIFDTIIESSNVEDVFSVIQKEKAHNTTSMSNSETLNELRQIKELLKNVLIQRSGGY